MKKCLIMLIALCNGAIFSQQLQVNDKDSQLGIVGVLLLSVDKSVTTNEINERSKVNRQKKLNHTDII